MSSHPQKLDKPSAALIQASWSGPIPPPAELEGYEKAFPGAAVKIMAWAEEEGKHRHAIETEAIQAEIAEQRAINRLRGRGQIFGFLIAVFTVTAGAYTAIHGSQIAGSFIGTNEGMLFVTGLPENAQVALAGDGVNALGIGGKEGNGDLLGCRAGRAGRIGFAFLFRIPKAHQAGLAQIIAMNEEVMAELSAALESASPALHPQVFAERLASKVSRLSGEEVSQIIRTLVGLYQARDTAERPAVEFVEKVCKALESSESGSLKLSSGQREVFTQRLLTLLGFDKSLGVTSKAFDLMTERERILCETRILTDIRLVFGKPSERPTAAVIIHNLKLTYHEDGEHHEFFAALDNADIRQLKGVLERAERKAQSLQALLKTSEVPYLEEA